VDRSHRHDRRSGLGWPDRAGDQGQPRRGADGITDQVVRELYLAMGSKKIIVPIELEPADLPDELAYILAPFQRHALQAGDMRSVLSRALDAV
jgi:hypothetical protein